MLFSEVTFIDCQFLEGNVDRSVDEDILGTFISILVESQLTCIGCEFSKGTSNLGGAIYSCGLSTIILMDTMIKNCESLNYGGALYATGFEEMLLINVVLVDNYAGI